MAIKILKVVVNPELEQVEVVYLNDNIEGKIQLEVTDNGLLVDIEDLDLCTTIYSERKGHPHTENRICCEEFSEEVEKYADSFEYLPETNLLEATFNSNDYEAYYTETFRYCPYCGRLLVSHSVEKGE